MFIEDISATGGAAKERTNTRNVPAGRHQKEGRP
jgi:hypothetical protein